MDIIAAPARQLKTVSFWLVVATGVFDLAVTFLQTLGTLDILSAKNIALINAVMAFLIGVARFIAQQIAVTTDEKVDIIAAAAAAPVKAGHSDVNVEINGMPAATATATVLDASQAKP